MVALAAAVLITFIGGLYFIAHNKSEEAVILPSHGNHTGNGLPPKPEERWRYIKELENRQIGVQTPTEPTAGGEVQTPAQLTDEQRQLLEQMQADMRQQPTHLNEVPYNDQVKTPTSGSRSQQKPPVYQEAAPRQMTQPAIQPPRQTFAPAPQPVAQQPRQTFAPAPQPVAQQPRQTFAPAPQPRQAPAQQHQTPATQPSTPSRQAPITAVQPAPQPTPQPKAQAQAQAKPEKEPKEKTQRFIIQCGSFKAMDQAEAIRAQLAFGGIESRITSSGGWNRVMLGPYSSRASADKSLQNLKASGVSNCIPVATGG